MKKFTVLACLLLLIGCATGPQNLPESCGNDSYSLIVSSGVDINSASILTRSADNRLLILACLDTETCSKSDVINATAALRMYLETANPTYAMLSIFFGESNLYMYAALISELAPIFNQYPGLVSDCDKDILLRECDRIDLMVMSLP